MQDPYDFHPNHPANKDEPVERYGYICPNQFADFDDLDLKGLDEQLDIDEARKVARQLANETGLTVELEVQDEDGEEIEKRRYSPIQHAPKKN